LCTFHEVLAKGLAVVYLVSVTGADAETGEVLVEVDKQHLGSQGIHSAGGNVHPAQQTQQPPTARVGRLAAGGALAWICRQAGRAQRVACVRSGAGCRWARGADRTTGVVGCWLRGRCLHRLTVLFHVNRHHRYTPYPQLANLQMILEMSTPATSRLSPHPGPPGPVCICVLLSGPTTSTSYSITGHPIDQEHHSLRQISHGANPSCHQLTTQSILIDLPHHLTYPLIFPSLSDVRNRPLRVY
jgi:hypothetical protein